MTANTKCVPSLMRCGITHCRTWRVHIGKRLQTFPNHHKRPTQLIPAHILYNASTDVILDILDRYPDLTPGVNAAVYDMALRSRDIDRLQDRGLHAIVKTAAVTLGHHSFKQPETNTITSRPVIAMHGTPTVELVDGDGHKTYQPLQRVKTQSKTSRGGKKTMYGTWAIPDKPVVPTDLVGATTSSVTTAPPKNGTANPTDAASAASQPFPNPIRSSNPSTESVKTPNPPTANSNRFCPTAGSALSGKTEFY